MKKIFLGLVMTLVLGAVSSAFAASYEVVCAKCYVTKGEHGASHMACGAKCVAGGGELALLKGTKLYVPVDDGFNSLRDQFKDKVGQTVQLDGKVENKGGVNYLVVAPAK
ncbi:MAG TPA: hypothetical protein VMU88_10100 [bacterium]|nr:hypothetical protein [bacterium]